MKKKSKTKRLPKWVTWTVEISVARDIVADGFDLDNDRAHDLLQDHLPYSYGNETKAKVIQKPSRKLLNKIQQAETYE